LSKENEVLKHQLKKYIGAVQLLKESGRRTSLEVNDEEILHSSAPIKDGERVARYSILQFLFSHKCLFLASVTDESTEGAEYERKLIQVAEMHGELMEFNAYLQGLLQRKDNSIRRLREELVDLRGPFVIPLPGTDEDSALDIDNNIYSDLSAPRRAPFLRQSFTGSNERVLINIWIPSAFLTGATNDLHHVYQACPFSYFLQFSGINTGRFSISGFLFL
jgi:sorting nexin-29